MAASPTLHLRILWPWQRARWLRRAPGRAGLATLVAYPALFFAPLQRFPLFDSWAGGASALLLLGTLGAAFAVMRDVGAPHAVEFWLFQKGVELPAVALTRWAWDLLLGAAIACWWALGFTIAATDHGLSASVPFVAVLACWLLGNFAIVGTLLLALGATGYPRAIDSAILILLLTAFAPLLGSVVSPMALRVLEAILPPFHALIAARQAISSATHWPTVVGGVLQTATWMFVMVLITTHLIERRIPRADHSRADG